MEQLKKLFTIIALVAVSHASATKYYIAPGGNNLNSGLSPSLPWANPPQLNSTSLNPGDSVLFARGGSWHFTLPLNQSGSNGNPIYYGAYGTGADPVLTGFVSLTSWTNLGSNIWSCALSAGSSLNMVTVNGALKAPGRYPNTGWLPMNVPDVDGGGNKIGSQTRFFTDIASPSVFSGANAVIKKREWIIDKVPISSISGSQINFSNVNEFPALDTWGFFITDHIATLDQQYEWVYNGSTLYMYSTTNPATMNVRAATFDAIVTMSGKNYLKFENLTFEGGKGNLLNMSSTAGITMTNCTFRFAGRNGIDANFMGGFIMRNCTVQYINNSGVDAVLGTNQKILNNSFSYIGMNQSLCGPGNKANHAMFINGMGSLIDNNTVAYTGYVGIDFGGNYDTISNNYVHHFAQTCADGGGIYTSDETSAVGRRITNNIVMYGLGPRDGTPFPGYDNAMGIYLDESSAGVTISGNLSAYNNGGGLYLHKAHDLVITGNSFIGNSRRQVQLAEDGPGATNITNVVFTGNKLHSSTSSDFLYVLYGTPNVNTFFSSINNNILSRPSSSSNIIRVVYSYATTTDFTLASWKAAYPGYDAASTGTPAAFASGSPRFEFNASNSPITVQLDAIYQNIQGALFDQGSVTIPPWSSEYINLVGPLPSSNSLPYKGRLVIVPGP